MRLSLQGKTLAAVGLDISVGGIAVRSDTRLTVGEEVELAVVLLLQLVARMDEHLDLGAEAAH